MPWRLLFPRGCVRTPKHRGTARCAGERTSLRVSGHCCTPGSDPSGLATSCRTGRGGTQRLMMMGELASLCSMHTDSRPGSGGAPPPAPAKAAINLCVYLPCIRPMCMYIRQLAVQIWRQANTQPLWRPQYLLNPLLPAQPRPPSPAVHSSASVTMVRAAASALVPLLGTGRPGVLTRVVLCRVPLTAEADF